MLQRLLKVCEKRGGQPWLLLIRCFHTLGSQWPQNKPIFLLIYFYFMKRWNLQKLLSFATWTQTVICGKGPQVTTQWIRWIVLVLIHCLPVFTLYSVNKHVSAEIKFSNNSVHIRGGWNTFTQSSVCKELSFAPVCPLHLQKWTHSTLLLVRIVTFVR